MGHEVKLTPTTAAVIHNGNFASVNANEIKQNARAQIGDLLRSNQITEQEAKDALKYLDGEVASALARRNTVEGRHYDYAMNGVEDLPDAKANQLMKDCGLTIGDLYSASQFAGADYEVSYTHLNKDGRAAAERGEITESELKNIQNDLNARIKENGGDRVLTDKETKQLMEGLGLSVEGRFQASKILRGILGGLLGGSVLGAPRGSASATAISPDGVVARATATIGGAASLVTGSAIGVGSGLTVGIIQAANRKEKPYGVQGGAEGGQGSVTNKTEARMHELGTTAGDNFVQPQVEDPMKDFLE